MNTQRNRIVVVDDCDVTRQAVQAYLAREGFAVRAAGGGGEMRRMLREEPADLCILDLQMPEEDGLSIARFLRDTQGCGIIMLTAKTDVTERIVALELGADDFLCKPHDQRELLARARSVLRRLDPSAAAPGAPILWFGDWAFDRDARCLHGADGQVSHLTTAEFKLLGALVERQGHVLTREHLLGVVYERPWDYFDRSIDVLVTRLRRKIEAVDGLSDSIKSVRSAGYVFGPAPSRPATLG